MALWKTQRSGNVEWGIVLRAWIAAGVVSFIDKQHRGHSRGRSLQLSTGNIAAGIMHDDPDLLPLCGVSNRRDASAIKRVRDKIYKLIDDGFSKDYRQWETGFAKKGATSIKTAESLVDKRNKLMGSYHELNPSYSEEDHAQYLSHCLYINQEKSGTEPMTGRAQSIGAGTGVPTAVAPRLRRPTYTEADIDLLLEDDAAAEAMDAALGVVRNSQSPVQSPGVENDVVDDEDEVLRDDLAEPEQGDTAVPISQPQAKRARLSSMEPTPEPQTTPDSSVFAAALAASTPAPLRPATARAGVARTSAQLPTTARGPEQTPVASILPPHMHRNTTDRRRAGSTGRRDRDRQGNAVEATDSALDGLGAVAESITRSNSLGIERLMAKDAASNDVALKRLAYDIEKDEKRRTQEKDKDETALRLKEKELDHARKLAEASIEEKKQQRLMTMVQDPKFHFDKLGTMSSMPPEQQHVLRQMWGLPEQPSLHSDEPIVSLEPQTHPSK